MLSGSFQINTIESFGDGKSGQLGLPCEGSATPIVISSFYTDGDLKSIREIACGGVRSICVTTNEEIFEWGSKRKHSPVPLNLSGLEPGHQVVQLCCGPITSLALTESIMMEWSDGCCWPTNREQVQYAIATGMHHCAAISANRLRLTLWSGQSREGTNRRGQFGVGSTQPDVCTNTLDAPNGRSFRSVSCGSFHTLVQMDNGDIYGWGDNRSSQLGDRITYGNYILRMTRLPHMCPESFPNEITQIACGDATSFLINSDGEVYSMGSNIFGQLGLGHLNLDESIEEVSTPTLISGLSGICKLVAGGCTGSEHCIAVSYSGVAYSWGGGASGQLGHGDYESLSIPKAIDIKNGFVVSASVGTLHSCLIVRRNFKRASEPVVLIENYASMGLFGCFPMETLSLIVGFLSWRANVNLSGAARFFRDFCLMDCFWRQLLDRLYRKKELPCPASNTLLNFAFRHGWYEVTKTFLHEEDSIVIENRHNPKLMPIISRVNPPEKFFDTFSEKAVNFISDLVGTKPSAHLKGRILLLGLDAAGKTTIIENIKTERNFQAEMPTIGFTIESTTLKGWDFTSWDVGGGDRLRQLWTRYYSKLKALIWVIDSSDRERFEECCLELTKFVSLRELAGAPILILANKCDLPECITPFEIACCLKLRDVMAVSSVLPSRRPVFACQSTVNKFALAMETHPWLIRGTSGLTGLGLREGLDWLSLALSGKANRY